MASAYALAIFRGIHLFQSKSGQTAVCPDLHFHRKGRKETRQLSMDAKEAAAQDLVQQPLFLWISYFSTAPRFALVTMRA